MQEWYYVKNGQQQGPVHLEQLRELAMTGSLKPEDLVWNAEMKDWTPAGEIDGIFSSRSAEDPQVVDTEVVDPTAPAPSTGPLPEIDPGSEPLDIGLVINRVIELAKRHIQTLALLGVIFFGITAVISIVSSFVQGGSGLMTNPLEILQSAGSDDAKPGAESISSMDIARIIVITLIQMVVSTYLSLGLYRCCLKLVANQAVEIPMLFGEAQLLLRAIGATIVISIAVTIGILLLIVPGIYVALRMSQVLPAIVDRNLSITEAINYSASITKNNLLKLLGLWALAVAAMLVIHLLTCGLGAIITTPVMTLGAILVYRYLQYGRSAALDHPGTQIPMLSGQPD